MNKKFIKEYNEQNERNIIKNIPSEKDEIWVKLNTSVYPLIKPYYYVSNKGRIYNHITKHMLKSRHLDATKYSSPYYRVSLQIEINNLSFSQTFAVHRLMMISFFPVKGMNKLYVNHKDGNKLNDDLNNLEWVTNSENILHAIKTGLFIPVSGENHCCATITRIEAEQIRDLLLERKYNQIEIAEIMGTTESIVNSIATRKSWKEVTEGFDLSCLKFKIPKLFTFDQIDACCVYFELNKKPDNLSVRRHCMNALKHIEYNNKLTEGAINSIRSLYKKERYLQISMNYDF